MRERASPWPWVIAGASLVALVLVLLLPTLRGGGSPSPFASISAGPLDNGGALAGVEPPPLTGTPREQADRLFDRVMRERSGGNAEGAAFFVPMAITAYRQAKPLDSDGLYHLSMLEAAGGQPDAARATAESILVDNPRHLLGLAAAAEAAVMQGDTAAARTYYRQFLDHFDAERERPLPEYLDHERVLPQYRAAAEELLGR